MVAPIKAAPSTRQYQVTVYGATGFTGQLVCEYLAINYSDQLKWAVAGRNKAKLEAVVEKLPYQSSTAERPDVIVASVDDDTQLSNMCKNSDVILSMAGPYSKCGTNIVKACVNETTHYCDITGETAWIMSTIRDFHEQAKKKGVCIMHSCGFDSLPSDLFTYMAQKHFNSKYGKKATNVDTMYQLRGGGLSGGTAASTLNMFNAPKEDREANRKDPYCIAYPDFKGPPIKEWRPFYSKSLQSAVMPFFLGPANVRMVLRSHSFYNYGPQFTYQEGVSVGSLVEAYIGLFIQMVLGLLILLPWTRPLLAALMPKPGEGPSRERRDKSSLTLTAVASAGGDEKTRAILDIKGADSGYKGTSMMVSESAISLLRYGAGGAGKHAGIVSSAIGGGEVLYERLGQMPNTAVSVDYPQN